MYINPIIIDLSKKWYKLIIMNNQNSREDKEDKKPNPKPSFKETKYE